MEQRESSVEWGVCKATNATTGVLHFALKRLKEKMKWLDVLSYAVSKF